IGENRRELARERRVLVLVALDLDQDRQVFRRGRVVADLRAELVEAPDGVEVLLVKRMHLLEGGDRPLRVVERSLVEAREASGQVDALLVTRRQRNDALERASQVLEVGTLFVERRDALEGLAMVRVEREHLLVASDGLLGARELGQQRRLAQGELDASGSLLGQ